MLALVHLSPVLLVTAMLVVLRRPPIHAAIAGTLLVIVLWLAGAADAWRSTTLLAATEDTAVLFASTAFVIVPGLTFVIVIERLGVNLALSQWVRSLGLRPGDQLVFIVLGLAPLLEAMTGFGVSLIATVPLLLSLFERRVALRIALAGMAIMPWGTLGLATVIGASLSHLDASALASTSALTSAPVFWPSVRFHFIWQAFVSLVNGGRWALSGCCLSPCFTVPADGWGRRWPGLQQGW